MDLRKFQSAVLSGTLSGCITSVSFQPLEVIKTRLQQTNNANKSIFMIIKETYRQGGLRTFWNGLTPSIIRSVPVVAIYFTSIEIFRNYNWFRVNHKFFDDIVSPFLIGATARTIADVSMFPLSLIKTHYESDLYKHESIVQAFRKIFNENGLRGLYKGLSPTLLRDINYSGIYFMIYSNMKESLGDQNKSSNIALSALISGCFACLLTQPPDVLRTRMQLEPLKYPSLALSIKRIYAEEGLSSFFSGFIPRSTRRIFITVLSWTLFEKVKIKLA